MTRRRARFGAVGLLLVLTVGANACTKPSDPGTASRDSENTPGTESDGTPVFPVPKDTGEAVRRAGLSQLPTEKLDVHYHPHVDVIINDHKVTVAANIGISADGFSPLHTHDTSGTIHIESAKADVFRVGQLFAEWGVKLDKNCVATYCTDDKNQLLGFVNGQMVGDPASIPFAMNQEVVIWYGPRGINPKVPTSNIEQQN
jgi:hypothetical protein